MATGKGSGTKASGSGLTLSELKTICQYAGWRATSAGATAALVRFINDVIYMLASLAPWPEYLKRDGSQAIVSGTDEYALSETGIDRMGIVERADNTLPLDEVSVEDWLIEKRGMGYTGTPTKYAAEKGLSGGLTVLKMLLYPCPTSSETLYYSYFRKPAEISADDDIADWPDSRTWLLSNALEYIMAAGDNNVYNLHSPEFMSKVESALGDARASYLPIKTKSIRSLRDIRIRDSYWNITS